MAVNNLFSDLAARVGSGLAIAVVGLSAVWAGGIWYLALVIVIIGALIWELAQMLGGGTRRAALLAGLGAAMLLATWLLPTGLGLPLLFLPAIAGIALLEKNRLLFMLYTALIVLAGFGMLLHRTEFGLIWMLWLVLLVVATDISGYFAGRLIGGPKFWPRVSPKKTWSGTAAGWICAAAIGWIFMAYTGVGVELIGISVALSMASQMGDVAESAVKRKMGVKDSSHLIPGHGGMFDRFDGMLGAAFVLLLVEALTDFPPVPL